MSDRDHMDAVNYLTHDNKRDFLQTDDGGFVSVSLVRWMLKQIEKETDLTEVREEGLDYIKGPNGPLMVGVKMINRFERIDALCEEFHKRIDGERTMLKEVMEWLQEESETNEGSRMSE